MASMSLSLSPWLLLVLAFMVTVSSSEAYIFYAGSHDGWVVDPAESFNHWAERNRFQVNDTIVFPHEDGAEPVLLVTEPDFDACSTRSPVRQLDSPGGGASVFRFDRSGPFFFISGDEDRCQKGQKLYIIVMAVRPTAKPAAASAPGSSEITSASPPTGAAAPPPLGASQDPGMRMSGAPGHDGMSHSSSLGAPAPAPTSGAAGLNGIIFGAVVGVLGAFVL